MGIPTDREQYIHRLGRTGREGKGGEGILLIAPWEEYFLNEIKDLPLEKFPLPDLDPQAQLKVYFVLMFKCLHYLDVFSFHCVHNRYIDCSSCPGLYDCR